MHCTSELLGDLQTSFCLIYNLSGRILKNHSAVLICYRIDSLSREISTFIWTVLVSLKFQLFAHLNYKQLMRGPTNLLGHTLDLVIVKDTDTIIPACRMDQTTLSDHFMICLDLDLHVEGKFSLRRCTFYESIKRSIMRSSLRIFSPLSWNPLILLTVT